MNGDSKDTETKEGTVHDVKVDDIAKASQIDGEEEEKKQVQIEEPKVEPKERPKEGDDDTSPRTDDKEPASGGVVKDTVTKPAKAEIKEKETANAEKNNTNIKENVVPAIKIVRAEGATEGDGSEIDNSVVMIDGTVVKTEELTELDIKGLERRRDKLNSKAEENKYKRDVLNDKTRMLIRSRETLNNRIKKLIKEAAECKEERNTLNAKVQEAKGLRETLNKTANELSDRVNALKKERLPMDEGPSIGRLKRDLRDLEYKQMTSPLSASAERELVDKMKNLNQEIKDREKKLEANEDVKQAVNDSRKARQDAEAQHKLVGKLAEQAQKKHDQMVELYSISDGLRKELNGIHEQLVKTKANADEEHKMHIALIRQVHDFDKLIFGMRRKMRRSKKSKGDTSVKKQQREIMDKFKKGATLSTEDLLALQNK